MYSGAFIEIYNWHSRRLVHKTYRIVKLEKYPILRVENPLNFGDQQFYKTSEVLQSADVVPRDTESNTFYFNIYIDWNPFNQLYKSEWQIKGT